MGTAAVPIMVALTVASTAYSIKSQQDAASAVKQENALASRREGDAARGREIERRRQLMRALAAQSAQAGAAGGAPNAAIAGADIKSAASDLLYDKANTAAEQSLLRYRSKT